MDALETMRDARTRRGPSLDDGSDGPVGDDVVAMLAGRAAWAHRHLMRGDIDSYRDVIEHAPDFLLMDPFGGRPTGLPASDEHWQRIGALFREGRDDSFELIQSYVSADMVVLVANEHAHVAFGPTPAQTWSLRVTLVFQRNRGRWQLAHRHADPLVNGIALADAARITGGTNQG